MLPAAASFKKQGANRGALASFLVSTPESGVDSIAITYALLDPIMTVVRPVAAFITGIAAGFVENFFSYPTAKDHPATVTNRAAADPAGDSTVPAALRGKLRFAIRYALVDIWGDIVIWFFAGLLLAGVITVFIPERWSELVLGGGLVSMLAMLTVGLPVYICATASTPVAAALLLKGASPGAVLVFLLVGPATNMTSLSVLIKLLGRLGTVRYLLVIAVSAVAFGLGVDLLYSSLKLEPAAVIGAARETLPFSVKLFSAGLLLALSLLHLYWGVRRRLEKAGKRPQPAIVPFPDPGPQSPDRSCRGSDCCSR